ncbi:rod shape-determining protein RodA, partial [Staphylococcus simulans]
MKASRQQPNKSWIRRIDWVLIGILVIFAIISVVFIKSAMGGGQYSANFSIKQIIYYILGFIIAFAIMVISPKRIMKYTYTLYGILCVLLIVLLVMPETAITPIINGAKSWYSFGPISIQPSEFMKIILILMLAKIVSRHNKYTFNKSLET